MIARYTTSEFKSLWSEQCKYEKWLEVEIAVLEAYAELGEVPAKVVASIKKKAKPRRGVAGIVDAERIKEIEKVTHHDLIAFLENLEETIGADSKWIHLGLTSYDVEDTAGALLLKEAGEIVLSELEKLSDVLKRRATEEKKTVMAGRTHGIHAEPISLGLKFLLWYQESLRNQKRLNSAIETVSYGKISGACGTYSNISPELEKLVCKKLGLKPAPVSNQIIQRDRYAEFLSTLALIATSCEKIALEVRHLQRTEIDELQEPFSAGQKGSSAMPHKKNPVICERICGLARVVRANAQVGLENIPLWSERDISNSAPERIILPDSTILTHYILRKTKEVVDRLTILYHNIERNLALSNGLIFSSRVLTELIKKGINRKSAYKIVQDCSFKANKEGKHLKEIMAEDRTVKKLFSQKEIDKFFDPRYYIRWIDDIYKACGVIE